MSSLRRRVPVWGYLVTALVVLVAGLVLGWVVTANRAAAGVQVTWLPALSECTHQAPGSPLRTRPGRRTVLFLGPGTTCALQVRVVNHSGYTVQVETLSGDLMGAQSSHIITALGATNGGRSPGERLEAYWPVHHTIAPGHTFGHRVLVGYRTSGCDGHHGPMGIGGFPDARISVLGRGYTRSSSVGLLWAQQGPAPGCRTRSHQ